MTNLDHAPRGFAWTLERVSAPGHVGPERHRRSAGRRGCQDADPEYRRLARGWRRSLEVFERLRRQQYGRPLLELVNDQTESGPA